MYSSSKLLLRQNGCFCLGKTIFKPDKAITDYQHFTNFCLGKSLFLLRQNAKQAFYQYATIDFQRVIKICLGKTPLFA